MAKETDHEMDHEMDQGMDQGMDQETAQEMARGKADIEETTKAVAAITDAPKTTRI